MSSRGSRKLPDLSNSLPPEDALARHWFSHSNEPSAPLTLQQASGGTTSRHTDRAAKNFCASIYSLSPFWQLLLRRLMPTARSTYSATGLWNRQGHGTWIEQRQPLRKHFFFSFAFLTITSSTNSNKLSCNEPLEQARSRYMDRTATTFRASLFDNFPGFYSSRTT